MLRQVAPKATVIAVLLQRNTIQSEAERRELEAAAQSIGQQILIFEASSDRDIEIAFVRWPNAASVRCSGSARSCTRIENG